MDVWGGQSMAFLSKGLACKKDFASAGNRTRVNCLEGSYAHHYTTDAHMCARRNRKEKTAHWVDSGQKVHAVTRIRTWVTAATTQGPNH